MWDKIANIKKCALFILHSVMTTKTKAIAKRHKAKLLNTLHNFEIDANECQREKHNNFYLTYSELFFFLVHII